MIYFMIPSRNRDVTWKVNLLRDDNVRIKESSVYFAKYKIPVNDTIIRSWSRGLSKVNTDNVTMSSIFATII